MAKIEENDDKLEENGQKLEEKGEGGIIYRVFGRFFTPNMEDDPEGRRFGGSEIKRYMCLVAVLLIIFGGASIVLFQGFGPDKKPSVPAEVMSVDAMKSTSTGATTCGFYDDQFSSSMIGKSIKLPNINVMKSGPGYITINSGNPSTYAFVSLRDKNSNVETGSSGTVYGIYDGYKPHPNEGINNPVPTLKDAIIEPSQ